MAEPPACGGSLNSRERGGESDSMSVSQINAPSFQAMQRSRQFRRDDESRRNFADAYARLSGRKLKGAAHGVESNCSTTVISMVLSATA